METDYNPVVAARRVYNQEECARTFEADLEAHLLVGWVISTPEVFVMGRPVLSSAPVEQILDPWQTFPREAVDCWHIWLAAGNLAAMWQYLPFELPWFSFERDNRLKLHRFESLHKASNRITPCKRH
jgi:hypothetical protein